MRSTRKQLDHAFAPHLWKSDQACEIKAQGWLKSSKTYTCSSSDRRLAEGSAINMRGPADRSLFSSRRAEENVCLSVCVCVCLLSVRHQAKAAFIVQIVASVSSTVSVRCVPTCMETGDVCSRLLRSLLWSCIFFLDFAPLSCSTSLARDSSLEPKVGHPAFSIPTPKPFAAMAVLTHFPFFAQPRFRRAFPSYENSAGLNFLRFPEPKVCMLGKPRTLACLRLQSSNSKFKFTAMCLSKACIIVSTWSTQKRAGSIWSYLLLAFIAFLASKPKDLMWFCRARDSNRVQKADPSTSSLHEFSSPPLPASAELFAPLFPLFLSAAKPAAWSSLFAPLFPLFLSAPKPLLLFRAEGTLWPNFLLPRTSAWCIFPRGLIRFWIPCAFLPKSCILFLALVSASFVATKNGYFSYQKNYTGTFTLRYISHTQAQKRSVGIYTILYRGCTRSTQTHTWMIACERDWYSRCFFSLADFASAGRSSRTGPKYRTGNCSV